jgi:predicted DNA-binding transcriptional regulator AlpA
MNDANLIQPLLRSFEQDSPACGYLTQDEVAALLRLSPRTLERHRLAGTGPKYTKLGRRVVYKRSSVEAWAAANTFSSTSEAGGRND